MLRNSSEVEESMQMRDEQEINSIAEQKIQLEMKWEESVRAENGARIAKCDEPIMTSDRVKVLVTFFQTNYGYIKEAKDNFNTMN